MSYLPLARKYRPQRFDDLIGQPHVTATLMRALEGQRVAQAYLFAGMRGVGKTSAARILAKCLNCASGQTARPCDRCASCLAIMQGSSLDVIEIDGASNRGIDEIRGLRETIPFAPTSGPFRVYIIDEVHMLTPEAFNALLKTLEEPPAHAKFIFATTAAGKVPPTVLSRCQRFDFRRIDAATIVGALSRVAKAEALAISEPALYAIARASDGSLRDAEVILEQLASFVQGVVEEADVTALLGAVESDALFGLTQAIVDRKATDALAFLHQQVEQGKDAPQLLAGLLRQFRNLLMVCSLQGASARGELLARLVDEPADQLARLDKQAASLTTQELLLALQILTGAYELVRRSPMGQMILELAVIKLSTREQWQSLDEISRRLDALSRATPSRERGGSGAEPPPPVPVNEDATPRGGEDTAEMEAATRGRASEGKSSRSPSGTTPSASAPSDRPPPAAGAATEVALESLVTLWPTFLERLGVQKMSLAAYLADSKPLRVDGRALTVGLPAFALHQEVLSLVDNRRLITGLLSELCQTIVTVHYETLPASVPSSQEGAGPAAAPPATPPLVQDIVKLFDATLLDRPRPT
jgi:DNA polymerase-3 subunit gamma/tau